MKKALRKMLGLMMSATMVMGVYSCTVYAADGNDIRAVAIINIEDPKTGETYTYEEVLPESAITEYKMTKTGETPHSVEASINLGDYITPRSSISLPKEYDEGVIITAKIDYLTQGSGLDFKAKTTKLSGDISLPNSFYYTANRHYNCRDSALKEWNCCDNGTCPSSNSWSINPNSTYERISRSTPPFVLYEADIFISGMSQYERHAEVLLKLDQF